MLPEAVINGTQKKKHELCHGGRHFLRDGAISGRTNFARVHNGEGLQYKLMLSKY